MISGSVTGGLIGLAWVIGFIMYFFKRHRREQRARAAGYRGHREMLDPLKKQEPYIIPPDPAIVEGQLAPGDTVYDDPKLENGDMPKWSKSMPLSGKDIQSSSPPAESTAPTMQHSISEPTTGDASSSSPSSSSFNVSHDPLQYSSNSSSKGKGKVT